MNSSIRNMAVAVSLVIPCLPSLAIAQTEVPQAETSAGPAVAESNNTTYIAWAGYHAQPENLGYRVAYTTLGGSQTVFNSTYTTVAPALAAARGTVFLAIRGNLPSTPPTLTADSIYYSSLSGTALPAPTTPLPSAKTTAAPALAGDSSTLFAAWTTLSGVIDYATYTGSWSAPQATPFTANPQTGPSLAVFNGNLYLAWAQSGSNELMSASLSLSGGSWSSAQSIGATSSVAPSLGVFNAPPSAESGLYVAYASAGDVSLATYNAASGFWSPGPIPPGPLATVFSPALFSVGSPCSPGLVGATYSFDVFYTATGTEGRIDYEHLLTGGKCYAQKCNEPCQ